MEDYEDSPRSSRSGRKKSNALAKLVAKKRSAQGSEDGSDFGSRTSLGSHTTPRSGRRNLRRDLSPDSSDEDNMKTNNLSRRPFNHSSALAPTDAIYRDSEYRPERPSRSQDRANSDNFTQKLTVKGASETFNGSNKRHGIGTRIESDDVTSNADSAAESDSSQEEIDDEIKSLRDNYTKVLLDKNSSSSSSGHQNNHYDRASSEVDLRKRDRLHDNLLNAPAMEKRTASLSHAETEESLNRFEEEDQLADLRRIAPRPSGGSPTPAHRQNSSYLDNGTRSFDRPWSAQNDYSGGFDNFSERSATSTSALQQITTQRARYRSFLVGSANHGSSLLGMQELERYFPDRKIRVFVGTWNMAEIKQLPKNLDDFVHPQSLDYVCDVYAFGTQESTSNRREWEISIQESLGPSHVLYHSASIGVLYLSIFIRRDLIWYSSVSEEAFVNLRVGAQFKTKAGLGVCFTLFGTSFLFINCHLNAHEGNLHVRLKDINAIEDNLQLPAKTKMQGQYQREKQVTGRFDNVFWCGDMNFRLAKEENRTKAKISGLEEDGNYEELLEYDELHQAMTRGEAFVKFSEGRIKFRPTYKYEPGTDHFEDKKSRVPSYTDRVLFRCKRKGSAVCLHYDSVPEVRPSDHKPVYGVYEVNLRPGRDNVQLSGGQFDRDIWKTAMTRRSLRLDVLKLPQTEKQSSVCSLQ